MAKPRIIPEKQPFPPEGYRLGSEISCDEMEVGRIAVTPGGRATAFIGFVDGRKAGDVRVNAVSFADRYPDAGQLRRFVSLDHGTLNLSSFLGSNDAYRVLPDVFVRLPSGADGEYGVFERAKRKLDADLTRQIFGTTQQELHDFLPAFQQVTDVAESGFYRHARITFSKSRDNRCDVSQAWIPERFPFIAFGDTSFYRGHVSLHGIYRLMAFLCTAEPHQEPYGFTKLLMDAGADAGVIQRMKDAFFNGQGDTIIRLATCLRDDY